MKETGSSFSKRVQETGEQRLTSMLIEPIQRLPRYNLYIDNIVKQLPARHPAIKSLLKARDIISSICDNDATQDDRGHTVQRLMELVPSMPNSVRLIGRLVTAVDIVELRPPCHLERPDTLLATGILLLFTDYVVILRKGSKSSMSARSLTAHLDGTNVPSSTGDANVMDLDYRQAVPLRYVELSELEEGKLVQLTRLDLVVELTPNSRPGSSYSSKVYQVYQLLGSYEGKASKLTEELVKAK
ncbi:hypothetical protein LTS18_002249, partial [Coniosporium uncinatum]